MLMSSEAFAGLKTVVEWNPFGARFLLGILRQRPAWVHYKDDPCGPLHLIKHVDEPMRVSVDRRLVAVELAPFPANGAGRERFGQEWRHRDVSKAELAGAIAGILAALPNDERRSGG